MKLSNACAEGRIIGGLIIAAAAAGNILMLHHPTSFNGADDGLLLHDWTNALVHSGMMACLCLFLFAFAVLTKRLGEEHLAIRAGGMAISGGLIALIIAAFINGFVVDGLQAMSLDPIAVAPQFVMLRLVNQKLALLGIALMGASMALWAPQMLRRDGLSKLAGGFGIAMALLAGYWLFVGGGVFGLHVAAFSMFAFSAWSLIIAAQLIRGRL